MSFTTEYSLWYVPVCLGIAVLGAWFLYRNNPLELKPTWANWLLAIARGISLFVLGVLLLGPLMHWIRTTTQKPILVLALDASESVAMHTKQQQILETNLQQLKEQVAGDFDIETLYIGGKVTTQKPETPEKQTNLEGVFDYIASTYGRQNLGAVVLASDGLYNTGGSPLANAQQLQSAIYTIALGDSNAQKDVLIKQVKHNQLVYAGNAFPLAIAIAADGYAGKQTTLTVMHDGQVLVKQPVAIASNNFYTTIPVSITATKTGLQHYTIRVTGFANEVTQANNTYHVYIKVLDGKQKIALVYASAHPDVTALKQSIEQMENQSVQTFSVAEFPLSNIGAYSLLIAHQLPSVKGEGESIIKRSQQLGIPVWYIVGGQTALNRLYAAEPVLQVNGNRTNTNEATPMIETTFSLFTLNPSSMEHIRKYPPLLAPYGQYNVQTEHDVLLTQQIGSVATKYPLLFFTKNTLRKTGYLVGEGFWKWRLYDAGLSNQQTTNMLVGKCIQYLAAKGNNNRFRVSSASNLNENEPVVFEAEVYNESYELSNTYEVGLQLVNEKGKKYEYTFSKTATAYQLDAGVLPPGSYAYTATAKGSGLPPVKGNIQVMPLQLELLQTKANHQLLNELAVQNNGKRLNSNNLDELAQLLLDNENNKPVLYEQQEQFTWIELKWIALVLIGLMGIEWFVRKWNGTI